MQTTTTKTKENFARRKQQQQRRTNENWKNPVQSNSVQKKEHDNQIIFYSPTTGKRLQQYCNFKGKEDSRCPHFFWITPDRNLAKVFIELNEKHTGKRCYEKICDGVFLDSENTDVEYDGIKAKYEPNSVVHFDHINRVFIFERIDPDKMINCTELSRRKITITIRKNIPEEENDSKKEETVSKEETHKEEKTSENEETLKEEGTSENEKTPKEETVSKEDAHKEEGTPKKEDAPKKEAVIIASQVSSAYLPYSLDGELVPNTFYFGNWDGVLGVYQIYYLFNGHTDSYSTRITPFIPQNKCSSLEVCEDANILFGVQDVYGKVFYEQYFRKQSKIQVISKLGETGFQFVKGSRIDGLPYTDEDFADECYDNEISFLASKV